MIERRITLRLTALGLCGLSLGCLLDRDWRGAALCLGGSILSYTIYRAIMRLVHGGPPIN